MSSIFPILFETILKASKAVTSARNAPLNDLTKLIGPHVADITLVLHVCADSMRHVKLEMHDPRGEEKPAFSTARLMDELLLRFAKGWASPEVTEQIQQVVELESELDKKLSLVVPMVNHSKPGRASPWSALSQAQRLSRELEGFLRLESDLKNSAYQARSVLFPQSTQHNSSARMFSKSSTIMSEIWQKITDEQSRIGALSNSVLVETLVANICKSDLLRDPERPVYGTSSMYFYLPAIADRLLNPVNPEMNLEYLQMATTNIRKALKNLEVIQSIYQPSSEDSPEP